MPSIHTILINASGGNTSEYSFNQATRRRHDYSHAELRNRHNQQDTWHVEHNLDARDLRILFKILARHYEDGGRKRGAILRYIKYFRDKEDARYADRLPLHRLRTLLHHKSS